MSPSPTPNCESLISENYRRLYRFLFGLCRSADDAEDLTQQTFVRAIQAIHRYDGRVPMRNWLFAIAFREFQSFRRRRLWLPLLIENPSKGDPFGDLLNAHAILQALGKVSAESRGVFLLHYVEDLSIGEIAATLVIPEGTVKSRLHHARQQLRSILGEELTYATEPV